MKSARFCIAATCVLLVTLATGFLLGWFLSKGSTGSHSTADGAQERSQAAAVGGSGDVDPDLTKELMDEIRARNIESNLRWLSAVPRVAGTEADLMQARSLQQLWKDQGLDNSGVETYDVLLSYPGNDSAPNKVQLLNSEGNVMFDSVESSQKNPLPPFGEDVPAFNAYSRSGVVEGDVIYVDFGQRLNFATLAKDYNVSFAGKIALARLGGCSVRNKVRNAAEYGAAALLTFPNPLKDAEDGYGAVYPDTWWMPADAERMGSILLRPGDPLTPGYPAKQGVFRRPLEEAAQEHLTEIPVQPISAQAAMAIFSHMAEDTPLVKTVWPFTNFPSWHYERLRERAVKETTPATRNETQQELSYNSSDPSSILKMLSSSTNLEEMKAKNDNISLESALRIGGNMKDGATLRVEVHTHLARRPTHDVFGIVRGAVEPDRIVVVGGHRDAWGHGAVDPGGGTATMLEISRAVGLLLRRGWRPRRTLLFASWGAEEFGLIGSTEWVEEKIVLLRHKAVAYINLDIVVTGDEVLRAAASPLLHDLVYDAAREVPHPKFANLFEAWSNYSYEKYSAPPLARELMWDSDYAPFFFNAGVASMSIYYSHRQYFFYPTYHTRHDTFEYVKKFIDPTFEYHRLMGQYFVNMIHKLVDSTLLPMTTHHYATALEPMLSSSASRTLLDLFFADHATLIKEHLVEANYCVRNFTLAAGDFNTKLRNVDKTNPIAVRIANDQLMLLERSFINDRWHIASGAMYPHVLFSPSDPSCFMVTPCCPGLSRAFCDMQPNQTWGPEQTSILHEEVSVLCHALNSAIDMMIF